MNKFMILGVLAALPAAALAQPPRGPAETGYDPYASAAIARGDVSAAEQRLARRLAENGDDVSAMLNLAYLMSTSGRVPSAARYYEQVLAHDEILLADADGQPISSHEAARRGMATLPVLASR